MEDETPIEGGHGLLMPFDTDDEQFARGFECGRVYQMVGDIINELDEDDYGAALGELSPLTIHAVNAEMVMRIAERYSEENELTVQSRELADGWIDVVFTWRERAVAS